MKWHKRHEFGLLLAIAVVLLMTTLIDAQHQYWVNPSLSAQNILRHTTLLGIFALGAAVVIISGGIDLSSGSVIAFGGTTCATLMLLLAPEAMRNNEPVGIGVIAAAIAGTLLVGFLIGSLHAWLITVVGLPPFVATLATLVGLRSFARAIIGAVTQRATQIQIADENFKNLTRNLYVPALVFLVLAGGMWLLLSRTVVGRHLYALGGNEEAARLSGIQTDRLKWLAYSLSAMLSALAGVFYISDQTSADPQTLGRGYELNAIAAAVVGGCSLQGGVGTIPGTVLGALFLRIVVDGVAKTIKTDTDIFEGMVVGGVVVAAVAFSQLRQAGRRGKKFFQGMLGIVTIVNLGLLAGAMTALVVPKLFGNRADFDPRSVSLGASAAAVVVLVIVRELERRRFAK